ncbi:MAG: filamentous hemagglutinin family protein [Desulfatibacillaceae bacterium]
MRQGMNMLQRFVVWTLAWTLLLAPSAGLAEPVIPGLAARAGQVAPAADALPTGGQVTSGNVSFDRTPDPSDPDHPNRLKIIQDGNTAILSWQEYDIGARAWTHYEQGGNADARCLNRIYDNDPSLIHGKLTADGQIYLINQNGILFGPGSRVDVNSLAASALNLADGDFINRNLDFVAENYTGFAGGLDPAASVVNQGEITTDALGWAYLLAPQVENGGTISSPSGHVALASGTRISLVPELGANSMRTQRLVKVLDGAGNAVNAPDGLLEAETGLVGMYGSVVNQEGVIRSVTAIKRGGAVELFASDRITTSADSVTETPVSTSDEAVHNSFEFSGGRIILSGLDPNSPADPATAPDVVDLNGRITAPSGEVTIEAGDRVHISAGSSVDVGGSWVAKPATDDLVRSQLNSVELRDDYGQVDGVLRGETVTASGREGSAIGDLSGALESEEQTALERATGGGNIYINSPDGSVVVEQGAFLDFSGGGFRYTGGGAATTRVLNGETVYDICDAPEWLVYDQMLGRFEDRHDAFGMVRSFDGLHYGGASCLNDFTASWVEGRDAGSLTLMAEHIVLEGALDGSARAGFFQVLETAPEDEFGNLARRGVVMPTAGTLTLGRFPLQLASEAQNLELGDVVIQGRTEALPGFGADDAVPLRGAETAANRVTYLSSDLVNSAGLDTLNVYSNTSIDIARDAAISLSPNGTFQADARRIEVHGSIAATSGRVGMGIRRTVTTDPNNNPSYVNLDEGIFLASGSSLSVAGRRVDNSLAGEYGNGGVKKVFPDGGEIALKQKVHDATGVVVAPGATLDVSGGYEVTVDGDIIGGDAGTVALQGSAVVLEGTLRGHSLYGNEGGGIGLVAGEVTIGPAPVKLPGGYALDDPLPAGMEGRLLLDPDMFARTGFTDISVGSLHDLTVEDGATIAPSLARLPAPSPDTSCSAISRVRNSVATMFGSAPGPDGYVTDDRRYTEATSVALAAGVVMEGVPLADPDVTAAMVVEDGSVIRGHGGGEIALEAPSMDVAGNLSNPGGAIAVVAEFGDLVLRDTAVLSAAGYLRPETELPGEGMQPGIEAVAGGTVSLMASNGNLALEDGSLLDVSGPVGGFTWVWEMGGIVKKPVAAGAGGVSLVWSGNLSLDGAVDGHARAATMSGGAMTVRHLSTNDALALDAAMLDGFVAGGFDSLDITSLHSLAFSGPADLAMDNLLTLNAPTIGLTGADRVSLAAPWVRIRNTFRPTNQAPGAGQGELEVRGTWVDVLGAVALDGVDTATISAARDLRLSDYYYSGSGQGLWDGSLTVPGNLVLSGARVYPTTASRFEISVDDRLTILPGEVPLAGPVYSAGGALAIHADEIDHRGVLSAPLGEIALVADNRVWLGDGGVTSTAGSAMVKYGDLDEIYWTIRDKDNLSTVEVEQAPEKHIDVQADELVVQDGALIDTSGGGGIFSYQFRAGIEGSANPLDRNGYMVVAPGGEYVLPGKGISVTGGAGMDKGTYTVLSDEHAFSPGAMVLVDLGPASEVVDGQVTDQGWSVVYGYEKTVGTEFRNPRMRAYAVRKASDVLREGYFGTASMNGGNAGTMSVAADTVVLDGRVLGHASAGGEGAHFILTGRSVIVSAHPASIPADLGFSDPIGQEFEDTLFVDSTTFLDSGASRLSLGAGDRTETVVMEADSSLSADVLTLSARDSITLGAGAALNAQTGVGSISLSSPDGRIVLGAGASVNSAGELALDTTNIDSVGTIAVTGGRLSLAADMIVASETGQTPAGRDVLLLDDELMNTFNGVDHLTLSGRDALGFAGAVSLATPGDLVLDTPSLEDLNLGGPASVAISASSLTWRNTHGGAVADAANGSGTISISASEAVIGGGNLATDGFSAVSISAANDLVLAGTGSLDVPGDLVLSAARVTAGPDAASGDGFAPAGFSIDAPDGTLTIESNAGNLAARQIGGGRLTFTAQSVAHSGIIQVHSGIVEMAATGTGAGDGVFVNDGGVVDVSGTDFVPGGTIRAESEDGAVEFRAGSLVDVSGSGGNGAGSLEVYAPDSAAVLAGDIRGVSPEGRGGRFSLDTLTVADLDGLALKLSSGGFTGADRIRARTGNLTLSHGNELQARVVELAADTGSITIDGVIRSPGGDIAIHAGRDANLGATGILSAASSTGDQPGGDVYMGAADGEITLAAQSIVDVSGSGAGQGGTLHLRASRIDTNADTLEDDVAITATGTVAGAERVTVEAYKTYPGATSTNVWSGDTGNFMTRVGSGGVSDRIGTGITFTGGAPGVHLLPGVEITNVGDLSISSRTDLTGYRYGGEPGILTIRTAGDLAFSQDLLDAPTNIFALPGNPGIDSWSFVLTAGADLDAANPLATVRGAGDFIIPDGHEIYTESGSIDFASGDDLSIGSAAPTSQMIWPMFRYNLGTYDGDISGRVEGDVSIKAGVIQSAAGDISLIARGDLFLQNGQDFGASRDYKSLGTIRTTGVPPAGSSPGNMPFYDFSDGGDISLEIGGDVSGLLISNAWAMAYGQQNPKEWAASFDYSKYNLTEGIAAMSGGSVRVTAGGDFFTQVGTFGVGDLEVHAGRRLDGRFLVADGTGALSALGSFGTRYDNQTIELLSASATLVAQGDLELGAVVNPTLVTDGFWGGALGTGRLTYQDDSSIGLYSIAGDVLLTAQSRFHQLGTHEYLARILPPNVVIEAGNDIRFTEAFAIAPSRAGQLSLRAGGTVTGRYATTSGGTTQLQRATIYMSDLAPEAFYASYGFPGAYQPDFHKFFSSSYTHGFPPEYLAAYESLAPAEQAAFAGTAALLDTPMHEGDATPVSIAAGTDIVSLGLSIPKAARVTAQGDIEDLRYVGQNIAPNDVTLIRAGGDMSFSSTPGRNLDTGTELGGPGLFVVQAGGSMDLGTSKGIETHGNIFHSALGAEGASVAVISGYGMDTDEASLDAFFKEIREAGMAYTDAMANEQPLQALALVEEARAGFDDDYLGGGATGAGDVDMVRSQIGTASGGNVYVVAAGEMNVGISFFTDEDSKENSGINTRSGGNIALFAEGDINVNESRTMTWLGGDITVWSNRGDINAGRGSKTAVNTSPPVKVEKEPGVFVLQRRPAAVGSGIRTLTFDPDGPEGPQEGPEPGDVYLFAPQGEIDAGEAGISGKNVYLGAVSVVNTQNIQFSGGSVGVPSASAGGAAIGALAGSGAMSQASRIGEEAAGLDSANRRFSEDIAELVDSFTPMWLKVQVTDYIDPF